MRVSPPELARELPGPQASSRVTRAPSRRRARAVNAPKAPAPTTATEGPAGGGDGRAGRAGGVAAAGAGGVAAAGGAAGSGAGAGAAGVGARPAAAVAARPPSKERREIAVGSSAIWSSPLETVCAEYYRGETAKRRGLIVRAA